MSIIEISNLSYSYPSSGKKALRDISLKIDQGEFVAILGRNASGKSTLAKHINALLELQSGSITVCGLDAGDRKNIYDIRQKCAMVFQNPDNQFVSGVVEEDVAFGLENYDYPKEQIPKRVSEVLEAVGMSGFEKRAIQMLSGGQKQRIAIAGVLAVDPDIILFDEATSMLDPEGRSEVLSTMKRLNRDGKTIIMITHYIEEAASADRIVVMDAGRITEAGSADNILQNKKLLEAAGLSAPLPVNLYYDLEKSGVYLKKCPVTNEELVDLLCQLY